MLWCLRVGKQIGIEEENERMPIYITPQLCADKPRIFNPQMYKPLGIAFEEKKNG